MYKPGQSGNPEGGRVRGRRHDALYAQLASDYGGEQALSGLQRVAIGQACRLLIKAERPRIDPETQVRLVNASARLLTGVARRTMDSRKKNAPKLPHRRRDRGQH
jgi:hypothetical protein